ncbi:MAG: hypothetical protein ACQESR_10755 [Planctomycetota bacterium]
MRRLSPEEMDTWPSSEVDEEGNQRGSSPGEQNGGSAGEFTGGTNYCLSETYDDGKHKTRLWEQ